MDKREEIQGKALELLRTHPGKRKGLGISMGVGKTLIALLYMDLKYAEGCRDFMVIIPKLSIIDSYISDATEFDLEYLIPLIKFVTYISLNKQDTGCEVLVLDECHNLKYNHSDWLDEFEGDILGLTGTVPKREYGEKYDMISKYCPIIYTYTTDAAVDNKILNDYLINIHYLYLDTINNIPVTHNEKTWYTSEKKTYDYWCKKLDNDSLSQKQKQIYSVMRMKALMGFRSKEVFCRTLLEKEQDKCIVFANTKEQADRLCDYTYHSGNPESKDNLDSFKAGIINQLACVLQLSEGVNIKNLKSGIILHSYSGNSPKTKQRWGRLLRLNPEDTCTLHLLVYKDTTDEKWALDAVEDLNQDKIKHII